MQKVVVVDMVIRRMCWYKSGLLGSKSIYPVSRAVISHPAVPGLLS